MFNSEHHVPKKKGGGGDKLDVVQRKYRQRMNMAQKVRQLGNAKAILCIFSSVHRERIVRESSLFFSLTLGLRAPYRERSSGKALNVSTQPMQ